MTQILWQEFLSQSLYLSYILIPIFFLMLIDLYTGVMKSKKAGNAVTSRGFRKTIEKFNIYMMAVISAHIVTYFFVKSMYLSFVVAGAIAMVELYSVFENVYALTGINLVKVLRQLLQKKNSWYD